jgi:hypothetical protein
MFKLLRNPGIDYKESISPPFVAWVRICKAFKERNRFPACRAGTTALFDVPAWQAISAGLLDSLESIPGLLKTLQIRAHYVQYNSYFLLYYYIQEEVSSSVTHTQ